MQDVSLASGVQISVVPAERAPQTPVAFVESTGPSRERRYELPRGASSVGRGDDNDVVLDDPLISRRHARVHVGRERIELSDLDSANGILVQGRPVPRLELQAGQSAVLGSTLVRAGFLPRRPGADPAISEILFTRSPSVEERYLGEEIEGADPPVPSDPQPFPWLPMLMPLLSGVVLLFLTQSMLSIVVIAMSPLMMLGTWLASHAMRRAKNRRDRERFEVQLARLSARLGAERRRETEVRRRESPELREIVAAVMGRRREVWSLRPEHWTFLHVRLGAGASASRNTVKRPGNPDRAEPDDLAAVERVLTQYETVHGVPVVESLADAGALGVCGPVDATAWYARGLVAQIAGTRGPHEFAVSGIFGPGWGDEFGALKWLPHASENERLLGGAPFATSAPAGAHLLARLEEIVSARSARGGDAPLRLGAMSRQEGAMTTGGTVGTRSSPTAAGEPLPSILVLIADDAPVDRARLIRLLEKAAGRGVHPIWVAADRSRVPAACRTFVELDPQRGASVGYVRLGMSTGHLRVEGLTNEESHLFARRLAAFADAGAVRANPSEVPRSVSMLSLIGEEMAEAASSVVDRWQQNGSLLADGVSPPRGIVPRLRAIVGRSASGTVHLDLRAQGPHALVGGTTGSGKSEFLQAWVLGMAVEYSPQRVTFLFVDYKGGAAFADCVRLPHCVGLVTDLSPHLVRRALVSLRAELHYRERLFAQKKAKDLVELEQRGDPETPPALVIVIDEFAALVGEVPEFVDGVVDVAQRGRSLGIHLIMATQRPAGVITDGLRANTSLRVALRMADEVDSDDVIGDKLAGRFDPALPGRAAAKTGPGKLSVFQVAHAGGWSSAEPRGPELDLGSFHLGPAEMWEKPERGSGPGGEGGERGDEREPGPNDQQRLVRTIASAARRCGLPQPRRPWLDELAEVYDLTGLAQRSDERLAFGVQDVPQRQTRSTVCFEPDGRGHLAVFGTGGSGKSTVLRTVAIAAGLTPRGGPVDVYALDFGANGLRMLGELPQVGAVITADQSDRVKRLFTMLRAEIRRRADAYARVGAGTIVQYRELAAQPGERRILLLIDGFPSFRDEYEGVIGRAESYETFQQILSDGRAVGIHAVLSADRSQSVPSSLQALIQQRVVLRMTDTDGYAVLGAPRDVIGAGSAPGRAIIDGLEAQVAVIGGARLVSEQAAAVKGLARDLERQDREPAPEIRALPDVCGLGELPETVAGRPVLGLSEEDLGPFGFDPTGLFVVAGGPGAGRSNTMAVLAASLRRAGAAERFVLLGAARSALSAVLPWDRSASDGASAMALIDELLGSDTGLEGTAVFVENAADYATSMAEMTLGGLARRARAGACLLVSEGDTSDWQTGFGLIGALKASRRGIILAPDAHDGEIVFNTPFPRLQRREFPPGRAMYVASGRATRVQVPLLPEFRAR
nr:FtsK/SpoIIIE domain-containing protein [Leucobacter weissii]